MHCQRAIWQLPRPRLRCLNASVHIAEIRVCDLRAALAPSVRIVDTRFTHLVGCRLPFQLAVLGGVGTTELAAAVSAGGGLGMVPYGVEPPATELGPSGIGFLIPYLPPVEVIAEAGR